MVRKTTKKDLASDRNLLFLFVVILVAPKKVWGTLAVVIFGRFSGTKF